MASLLLKRMLDHKETQLFEMPLMSLYIACKTFKTKTH